MDIIAKAKTTNLATITFIKWIMGALKNLRQNLEKSLLLWRVENLLEEAEILEKKQERVPQEIETIRGTRHELFKMMIKSIWRFNKVEDLWFKTEDLIKTDGANQGESPFEFLYLEDRSWNGIYFQFQGIEKGVRLMQSSLHSENNPHSSEPIHKSAVGGRKLDERAASRSVEKESGSEIDYQESEDSGNGKWENRSSSQ